MDAVAADALCDTPSNDRARNIAAHAEAVVAVRSLDCLSMLKIDNGANRFMVCLKGVTGCNGLTKWGARMASKDEV
jgi:hypothetical protein